MPHHLNISAINKITHVIEAYLSHVRNDALINGDSSDHKETSRGALSELIYYFIGHRHKMAWLEGCTDSSALTFKDLCNNNNPQTQKHLAVAIKETCYKYGLHGRLDMLKHWPTEASVIATFQKVYLENKPKKIPLEVDLKHLSTSRYDERAVLLFCIKVFKPHITFTGEMARVEADLGLMTELINAAGKKTKFIFANSDLAEMDSEFRPIFLSCINKGKGLVLDNIPLDRWTPDDFQHFIARIKTNPDFTSLSLVNTNLDMCCKNPLKYPYVIELLSLKQLKSLNLLDNGLDILPKAQVKEIEQAIANSGIAKIKIEMGQEPKVSASQVGIFAVKRVIPFDLDTESLAQMPSEIDSLLSQGSM